MKTKIIFFGNGPLADVAKSTLEKSDKVEIVFHARTKEDLEEVKSLKKADPNLKGVLASYGVMIKKDVLDIFEPEGILNVHPSKLPLYRGASPIESAILNGDTEFSVSVMKLVKAMDAGPLYHQATLTATDIAKFAPEETDSAMFPSKATLYEALASTGAAWIAEHINNLPVPTAQDDSGATFTEKFDKSLSPLKPAEKSSNQLINEIRAFIGFPKSKYTYNNLECIIFSAHISDNSESPLSLKCADGKYLTPDQLQPAGRKVMDAKSFINGYIKK